jgi:hypothetical protein
VFLANLVLKLRVHARDHAIVRLDDVEREAAGLLKTMPL